MNKYYAAGALAARQVFFQEKVAFGPADARKVLALAKKRSLPRRFIEEASAAGGPAWMQATARQEARSSGPMALETPARMAEGAPFRGSSPEDVAQALKQFGGHSGIAIGGKGDATRFMRERGLSPSAKTPTERMMLEAAVKGHELDELSVPISHAVQGFGHNSPEVLFRDHNRIVTMPAEAQGAADTMRKMREQSHETSLLNEHLAPFGFQFGQGERVSPSMRKAMTAHLESVFPNGQTAGQARDALAQQKAVADFTHHHGITPEDYQTGMFAALDEPGGMAGYVGRVLNQTKVPRGYPYTAPPPKAPRSAKARPAEPATLAAGASAPAAPSATRNWPAIAALSAGLPLAAYGGYRAYDAAQAPEPSEPSEP